MSYKLDVSNPQIKEKILDVLSDSATDWVCFGYDGSSTTKMKVIESGTTFSDMLEELNDGKVQYFYVRFAQGEKLFKYVFVSFVGEGAGGMLKGNSHNHTIDFANYLKTLRAPIHVQVNARKESDLDEDKLQKQLKGAMGANYDAGAKNQGVTGGVKTVGEGVKIHKEAQEESAKVGGGRALPFIPDNSTRQQFWSQHQGATKKVGPTQIINEEEKKKFWDQQQKEEAERKSQPTRTVVEPNTTSGASSLAKKFDHLAVEQQTAPPKPQPGKKFTPTPAPTSSAPPSKPPPVSAPPPSKPPPASVPPPVSAPPPSKPPPVSAPPPVYSPPPPVSAPPPSLPPGPPPNLPPGPPPPSFPPGPPPPSDDDWGSDTGYTPEPTPEAPPPLPPPRAEAPSEESSTVTALFPFEAEQPTDLSFNEGDFITVLDKTDPSGWWKGRDQYGNEGYFPMNFVQPN
eukprot:TRINITY_DN1927_c0_g1_i2.p1 TRINITY_DN1927_c0_g1~~TRINITY_DN1927_c0_g1_i2.p1  ORF type:complete len:456 (-),score=144.51 TRINITY_DN1927_c0_g1_i2:166-1533(-)